MAERIIEAEVVEERIIACLSCRRKNRLHKRSSSGTYKCGACRAELPDPFISTPRKSWRHYGSAAGWTALGAIAVLVIIGLSSRRDFRTTSAGKPSPIQISVPAVIPTPIPAITIPKFTSLAIPTLRPLPSVTPYRLRQAVSTPQSSEFEGTSTPINNQIIFDAYPDSSTRGRLTVSNGTSHHAIAKLIDTTTDAKVLSFAICARQQSTVYRIADGTYRLIFAFGDRVFTGTDRLESPSGFARFDDALSFATTFTEDAVYFDTLSVTLHAVIGGNAKTQSISRKEFERY